MAARGRRSANAWCRPSCPTERMAKKSTGDRRPAPPARNRLPLVNANAEVARWLEHYWLKLRLPLSAAQRLAVTNDRREFARWAGRRLNPMALGCYCYLPNASGSPAEIACGELPELLTAEPVQLRVLTPAARLQPPLPGLSLGETDAALAVEKSGPARQRPPTALSTADYRHLIFIEPDLLPVSTEVTVAHELIHLCDRVHGHPRKHRCHGYDSISMDEAALTERDPEFLRAQLREETIRRDMALRRVRPYRYFYICPVCHREYARVRRYTRPVSCGRCDRHYNLAFLLQLQDVPITAAPDPATGPGAPAAPAVPRLVALPPLDTTRQSTELAGQLAQD